MKTTLVSAVIITIIGLFCASHNTHSLNIKYACANNNQYQRLACKKLAKSSPMMTEENKQDLAFFKKCIVDFYCFKMNIVRDTWIKLPTFEDFFTEKMEVAHLELLAKRVERFFLRNNDWQRLLSDSTFRNPNTRECVNLLYVVAARYLYVFRDLRILSDGFEFKTCEKTKSQYHAPWHGACHLKPKTMKCTSDYDVKLLGDRSGTLTALFHEYFHEPLGREKDVPGFGKSPENLFAVNIIAFKLEYAMPRHYGKEKWKQWFFEMVQKIQKTIKYKLLQVVIATYKMKQSNTKYFNDLMSDQIALRSVNVLTQIYKGWTVEVNMFYKKVESFNKAAYYAKGLSFKRRFNIAYELVLGTIENAGLLWPKSLTEYAMALVSGAETYLTSGAMGDVLRHQKDERLWEKPSGEPDKVLPARLHSSWLSMLENWADTNKKYKGCVERHLKIQVCLLQLSKYLRRMFSAMSVGRLELHKINLHQHLFVVRANLMDILKYWDKELRGNGVSSIPLSSHQIIATKTPKTWNRLEKDKDVRFQPKPTTTTSNSGTTRPARSTRYASATTTTTTRRVRRLSETRQRPKQRKTSVSGTIQQFLEIFKCNVPRYLSQMSLSTKCMDRIHSKIRKYNTKYFMYTVYAEKKRMARQAKNKKMSGK